MLTSKEERDLLTESRHLFKRLAYYQTRMTDTMNLTTGHLFSNKHTGTAHSSSFLDEKKSGSILTDLLWWGADDTIGVSVIQPVVARLLVCKHILLLLIMLVEYRTALPRQLNECQDVCLPCLLHVYVCA